jgi:putative toxin-antitoxin system antitoxin component (TIGR02293 family)
MKIARRHHSGAPAGAKRVSGLPGMGSLGLAAPDTIATARAIDQGFPYLTIERFNQSSGLPVGVIAGLIQIPQRTLIRRKSSGRLRPDESERLLRVARVFEKALGLFDRDADSARQWLSRPSQELGGETPLNFARTEIGARDVEDLIGRLEHGVFT